jgi:hypothetical protein
MKAESGARSCWSLPDTARLRCVVIESGSFPLTQAGAEDFDETLVIAQMRGEPAAVFAQRALARIASIERAGRRFDAATVLTGDGDDAATLAARRLIVLGLSTHGSANGGMTELLLTARPKASLEVRFGLLGLVEEVLGSSNGPQVPVRLRFGEPAQRGPEPRSGVFHSMPRGRA